MPEPSEHFELRDVDASLAPGLPDAVRSLFAGSRVLPTAAPALRDLDRVQLRAGPAWSDPAFVSELREGHRALGADASSEAALDDLARGAPCVVTGQQPGLFAGPLYSAWKVLGAISLARELTRRHGQRVAAVYWCGSDDSDFEEVRRIWCLDASARPFRAELSLDGWEQGQQVGSVRGPDLAAVEVSALDQLGRGEGAEGLRAIAASFDPGWDLGQRSAAWMLRLFGECGLVVVDARSAALRRRGRDLFERYVREHRAAKTSLEQHADAIASRGWPVTLDDRARASGLFALEGDRRVKLSAADLDAGIAGVGVVAPSVLLRPLWQDAELAPIASVLGPGELLYHAQITPLYELLDVAAARPVPRPHVTLVPTTTPMPGAEGMQALLRGGDSARRLLASAALPASWREGLADGDRRWRQALLALSEVVDHPAGQRELRRTEQRFAREWEQLERALERSALAAGHRQWGSLPSILAVRGVPQERTLAAITLRQWWGSRSPDVIASLATTYAEAIDQGRSPTWLLQGGEV